MEHEFLKDLVELNEAIENFGYLDEEILEESLTLHIRKEDIDKMLQIPIGKIFATLNNNDVFAEMKDTGKKLSDYKMTGKDSILTVNKMKIYVYINGDKDQKELMHDKIASLEKKIEASHKKDNDSYDIPYGSIKSIYSLYKRVEKSVLKEDQILTEDKASRQAIADEKYAVKNDPEEYIYRHTMPTSLKSFIDQLKNKDLSQTEDLAMRRIEKMDNYPELKAVAVKLKSELSKRPIDREETSKLINQFKRLYHSSNIKNDVKLDMKLEKIQATRKVSSNLAEAVTFIDNSGNIRTTSAVDYEKSMHNAHDPREIENETEEEYMKKLEDFYKEFKLVKKFNIKKDKDGNIISVYED